MNRQKLLALIQIVFELIMLFSLHRLFNIDMISFNRYAFVFFMSGVVFDRFKTRNNLIWQGAKLYAQSNLMFFLVTNVMNSLLIWDFTFMLKNLVVSILMTLIALGFNRGMKKTFRKYFAQNVLILGVGYKARDLASIYYHNSFALCRVKAMVDCNSRFPDLNQEVVDQEYPIYDYKDLDMIIEKYQIDQVVIALVDASKLTISTIIDDLFNKVSSIKVLPRVNSMINFDSKTEDLDGILLIATSTGHINIATRILKRFIDIIGGLVGCFITLFLALVVKLVYVKNGDYSPIIFSQYRIGENGNQFKFYKFRTMIVDAEKILDELMECDEEIKAEYLNNKKLKNDPRVTRIGKILRRTSLDEFPQFFNVLKGDMSLVGPRPYLPREKADMGKYFNSVCACKPGLTGMWQAHGRSEVTFRQRLKLDDYYYKNWSVWLDFSILIKTFKQVVYEKGAN